MWQEVSVDRDRQTMIVLLLNLAGAVALLLWAVRMIRTSVERAFMPQLRGALRHAADRRIEALAGGAAAALMLQSATAVAMLVVAFAEAGTLAAPVGLAVLLGADLGSAVVARILLAPISAIAPVLLVLGLGLFSRGARQSVKQGGRLMIGLALVLIALAMIREATLPLRESDLATMAFGYLEQDLVSAFVIGALLAWLMHSSVAAILTFATLALHGLVPALPAAALVLGANLGGAAIPVLLTTRAAPAIRRILAANLMLRGGASATAMAAVATWPGALGALGAGAGHQAINLHIAFNLLLALLALPLVGPALRATRFLIPDGAAAMPDRLSALDETVLGTPDRAFACVSRELLRMAERVQGMLVPAIRLYRDWDAGVAEAIAQGENDVDRMHFEIKLYVARTQEAALTAAQARRAMDLASVANNLEDAADTVSTDLVEMALRMQDRGFSFSEDGWRDLTGFHEHVMGNVRLALDVLMTGDTDTARQLVEEKDRIRQEEQRLQERHLERLRDGQPGTRETSNIHQETLRALKQVNTAFTLVAYPIAEEAGDLLASRLARQSAGPEA